MMNNDLISREALLGILRKRGRELIKMNLIGSEKTVASNTVYECICITKDTPAVDAEPVRHGTWGEPVVVGYDGVNVIWARTCSACGYENRYYGTHYCPNCGAKMDGQKAPARKCATCQNDGWDMPQCRECNEKNGFKWYVAKMDGGAE